MKPRSQRVDFPNGRGQQLAGIIDSPVGEPWGTALVSHCFTCTKDLKALVRISRGLARAGLVSLRYDFTGLGDSPGDFSETDFSSTCLDLAAAAAYMRSLGRPVRLLVGHSLGGTAGVVTAQKIPEVAAVATIAAPSSTQRLAHFLAAENPAIEKTGTGEVTIGGRVFTLRRRLLEDLRRYDIEAHVAALAVPLLMFHSPADLTLPYEWGLRMFQACRAPKSFITLDGADHLLVDQPGDPDFVAALIATWFRRYAT